MHGTAKNTLMSQMSTSTVCVLVFDRLCRNGCTMAMYLMKYAFGFSIRKPIRNIDIKIKIFGYMFVREYYIGTRVANGKNTTLTV